MKPTDSPKPLTIAALIFGAVGAVASLACMFYVGRKNESFVLMALFTIWVLAPFVAAAWAGRASQRWPESTRARFQLVGLTLALASTGIYSWVAIGPPRPKPAFFFLVVPAASWLILAATVALSASRKGKDHAD